jgi:uncharacterized DUF497 family protein
VTFEDASSVFRNPLAKVLPDPTHTEQERRSLIIGHSASGRLLLVVFTETDDQIRIISARTPRRANVANMKSTRTSRRQSTDVDMPAEYELDWSKAKPNPYAARLKDTVAVVLAPDVAEVFPTSEAVNTFLRSVIAAVPRPGRRSTPAPRRHSRRGGLTMK